MYLLGKTFAMTYSFISRLMSSRVTVGLCCVSIIIKLTDFGYNYCVSLSHSYFMMTWVEQSGQSHDIPSDFLSDESLWHIWWARVTLVGQNVDSHSSEAYPNTVSEFWGTNAFNSHFDNGFLIFISTSVMILTYLWLSPLSTWSYPTSRQQSLTICSTSKRFSDT